MAHITGKAPTIWRDIKAIAGQSYENRETFINKSTEYDQEKRPVARASHINDARPITGPFHVNNGQETAEEVLLFKLKKIPCPYTH